MSATALSETGNSFTHAFLCECFDLDSDKGALTWKARPPSHFTRAHAHRTWNRRYDGALAGTTFPNGYIGVRILGKLVPLHRVIFAIANGLDMDDLPPTIDHRDTDNTNNRPSNLRGALHAQNSANIGKHSNNTSGFKGVNRYRPGARWEARIRAGGKRIHLGYFDTPEQGHAAYRAAAEKLHGQFARSS